MLHLGEQEEKNPATENLGIIVGAGPVGLYAAFILLMQDKGLGRNERRRLKNWLRLGQHQTHQ